MTGKYKISLEDIKNNEHNFILCELKKNGFPVLGGAMNAAIKPGYEILRSDNVGSESIQFEWRLINE